MIGAVDRFQGLNGNRDIEVLFLGDMDNDWTLKNGYSIVYKLLNILYICLV